jgi:hypothetical protein
MMSEPRCFERNCKHFQGARAQGDRLDRDIMVCPAFPKGIPSEIAYGKNLHLVKHPKQVGNIVYEKGR